MSMEADCFFPKDEVKPAASAENILLILNKSRTCMKQEEQLKGLDGEEPKPFVSDPKKLERLQ